MKKGLLLQMAFSFENSVKSEYDRVETLLNKTVEDNTVVASDLEVIYDRLLKAHEIIINNYIYCTIDMSVSQLEEACNNLSEAKSLITSADVRLYNLTH